MRALHKNDQPGRFQDGMKRGHFKKAILIVAIIGAREPAKINSLSDILSPGLVLSFAALGLFPSAAKKLPAIYRPKESKI
jgi:hypothetical protein